MKTLLLCLFFYTYLPFSYANFSAQDLAVEAGAIKVEFNTATNTGSIHVYRCEQCLNANYHFFVKPEILKKGKPVSFDIFLKEFWNAKFPTLILDKNTLNVLKIIY